MPVLSRVTVFEKNVSRAADVECVTAAASDDGNWVVTAGILHGNKSVVVIYRNAIHDKILVGYVAPPAVDDVVKLNERLLMLFVRDIAAIPRLRKNMFDTAIGDSARPREGA